MNHLVFVVVIALAFTQAMQWLGVFFGWCLRVRRVNAGFRWPCRVLGHKWRRLPPTDEELASGIIWEQSTAKGVCLRCGAQGLVSPHCLGLISEAPHV